VMQILHNSTSEVVGFEYNINWCSNNWVDTDQDGTPDEVLDYVCADNYIIGTSGISNINQLGAATENWSIMYENYDTYTKIIGMWLNLDSEETAGVIDAGCGVSFEATYTGNLHSVTTIGWVGVGSTDLGFTYDPCVDCEGYLDAEYPEIFILNQNYPNPFNPITNVEFTLEEIGFVNLVIYDITGRHIRTLVSDYMLDGSHSIQWNATNEYGEKVPSGIYIYQLSTNNMSISKRMTLLK